MFKQLPIGTDDFNKLRENNLYYIDKSLFIKDFIDYSDEVTLITRPRRFGKTLNMSMIHEFFDITKESKKIFSELDILKTNLSNQINTIPTIFISLKNCIGNDKRMIMKELTNALLKEYRRYHHLFANAEPNDAYYLDYFTTYEKLSKDKGNVELYDLQDSLASLIAAVSTYYNKTVLLLIDEYDQPIMSCYENHMYEEFKTFFSIFYGSVLKGNPHLYKGLLTGVQRVAKESIFSGLNNITVITVMDNLFSKYFGLLEDEVKQLLSYYNIPFTHQIKEYYNGYQIGEHSLYNPWSILNMIKKKELAPYWINTSTNMLILNSIKNADGIFKLEFDSLLLHASAKVSMNLETSFMELRDNSTLWGLLINSGYLTVIEKITPYIMVVRIPNIEVREEFIRMIARLANISDNYLRQMFNYLIHLDLDMFKQVYQDIVLSCTSYFDSKENAYHMLMLGMCITLQGLYKISSNIESGHGRSDIILESQSEQYPHIIIEFKQGDNIQKLKENALNQIISNQYYNGLSGKVLCLGIAHNAKQCEIKSKIITL